MLYSKRIIILLITFIILFLLSHDKNNHARSNNVIDSRKFSIVKRRSQPNFYYNRKKKDNSTIITAMDKAVKEIYNDRLERKPVYYDVMEDESGRKTASLTFDDGPHVTYTLRLLDVLRRYNVKATFFVVGSMSEKYPELLKAIYRDGHLIANHTYSHKNLVTLTEDEATVEWQACNNVIKYILHVETYFCRPPGGNYDRIVLNSASRAGLSTVFWTDNSGDYEKPGEDIIEDKVLYRITPGGIILMHDGVDETINVLPDIIQKLRERGYEFVRIDEMAQKVSGIIDENSGMDFSKNSGIIDENSGEELKDKKQKPSENEEFWDPLPMIKN